MQPNEDFTVSLKLKGDPDMPRLDYLHSRYPQVREMADLMVQQLWLNRDKGDREGWLTMTPWICWNEIQWHSAKLSMAIKLGNLGLITQYAADLANIAMFMLDNYNLVPVE